jgi:protein AroM
MDCMGYTWDMKQKAKKLTDKPVILPRTLIARVIDEMIS